jgi:transposase
VPDDPVAQELRLLCRDEVELITQRTALVNQLRAALREFYPAALEAFDDWTRPHGWHLVLRFPTPAALAAAGRRQWERFLKQHGLNRPQTRDARLACFARAAEFCSGNPAVTAAKSRLAVALATMLLTLQEQLDQYRRRIGELFDRHPDHDLFGSLPGAGAKLAPRLLAELGADRARFADPQALQCYAGTAPVSFRSGQVHRVTLRRACNKHLRAAVHLWADLSRSACAWAQAYYQRHRAAGQSHACALRCLGQRWLKILWTMWQRHATYDEARHLADQQRYAPPPLTTGGGAK